MEVVLNACVPGSILMESLFSILSEAYCLHFKQRVFDLRASIMRQISPVYVVPVPTQPCLPTQRPEFESSSSRIWQSVVVALVVMVVGVQSAGRSHGMGSMRSRSSRVSKPVCKTCCRAPTFCFNRRVRKHIYSNHSRSEKTERALWSNNLCHWWKPERNWSF
uniref:Uncharacterized protein n=1 Tax=Cacopsylla melanoneura TaxID=428564 RepID=A0A8D8X2A1_9HEMI